MKPQIAFRWRANDGTILNAGLVALLFFRGSGPVLLRYPIFCDLSGNPDPLSPPLDPPMCLFPVKLPYNGLAQDMKKKQVSTIRKYHNHTLQPNQPNRSENFQRLHRVDPSTIFVFSKLDSFSHDSLSLFVQIENNMQIKSGGNVPDPPPPLFRKITNGCWLHKNTSTSPHGKQLDILRPIVSPWRSMRPSMKYFDDYNVSGHTQAPRL